MAESLRIEATEDTPLIDFDTSTGVFKVTGRALPEDAHDFFKPIEEWVQDYVESPLANTTVEMRIDYFNSAATRYIFNLLMCFEDIVEEKRGDVKVVWYYKEGDDMIETKGEELSSILELPFEMVTL
jgi:hypothetical protein